jgi:hypothetical protein
LFNSKVFKKANLFLLTLFPMKQGSELRNTYSFSNACFATPDMLKFFLVGRSGGIGRRTRLKIVRPPGMRVQVPPSAPINIYLKRVSGYT